MGGLAAAREFDANSAIGAIVLTGSDKAFAAGMAAPSVDN
jgi:enoyl-CoA hydratase/carnithine racemase